jgi:single-stranded-DNA-specific exonuclease
MERSWLIKTPDPQAVTALVRDLGIPLAIAKILVNRGIIHAQKAQEFMELPPSMVPPPWEMEGMKRATEILENALRDGKNIAVYGDYDADGVTATALLVSYLKGKGGQVIYHIPHRIKGGYGLKTPAIKELAKRGAQLLITVDCGISNHQEVLSAQKEGMEVIITDHHEPPSFLPQAQAILHPKLGNYPFPHLAGVGVALKLVEAMAIKEGGEEERKEVWHQYLDLVALGTIGDMALLTEENRFYARFGLKKMSQSPRPGLAALIEVTRCKNKRITPWEVSFLLAPRVNAAGRMGEAERAFLLLLASEEEEGKALAQELQRENQRRQRVEEEIFQEALEVLERKEPGPFIVAGKRGWHPGVIGIVASRLAERFQRPAALVAFNEEGMGRGSARSYSGVDIYTPLLRCMDHLRELGGHRAAAGFSLEEKCLRGFKETLWQETLRIIPYPLPPNPLEVEGEIEMEELNASLLRGLQSLAPFGEGHPEPIFLLRKVQPRQIRVVGNGHLKFTAVRRGIGVDAIAFGLGPQSETLHEGLVDLAFTPELNLWNGEKTLQLKVKAVRRSQE